jgi:hypothetical protein
MLLFDIISIDGLPLTLTMIQDRVLQLRLASRKIMIALESNLSMKIKIRVNDSGMENLKANFLQRWHGRMHLECTHPCTTNSRWFKEVRHAFLSARARLSLLSLSVNGVNLHPIVDTLLGMGTTIQQLEIAFRGYDTHLLAASASIASLGHALTMHMCIEGSYHGGQEASLCLQSLVASGIRINSISFRSVR